jgi:poly-gamma-glutamate synthesis protein (capsule biosynthesis protein)
MLNKAGTPPYLFLIVLLFAVGCQNAPTTPHDQNNVSHLKKAAIKDTLHRIKLTFVGDIMGHDDQIYAAVDKKEHLKSKNMAHFNYEPCFRYIKPILEQADIAIGNLELTLNNKGRYTGFPMFRSPDQLAYALKGAGFDFLNTCNNHSNDGRLYGINHTIEVLDSLSMFHTGTFRDTVEWHKTYPLIIHKRVDGTIFKLAFLSYTYSTNGVKNRVPNIVNRINDSLIIADIQKAKASRPDMIIAMMHWGSEYKLDEREKQQKLARLLWKNGVDVVIGGHPHVIQPIKTDTIYDEDSSREKEVLVTYSLGNFISNQTRKNTDIGLIFELELIKNSQTSQTTIGPHHYILGWRYRYNYTPKNPFDAIHTVIPVSAFENQRTALLKMSPKDSSQMMSVTNRMRAHLGKWQSSERKINLAELGPLIPIDSVVSPPLILPSPVIRNSIRKDQGVPLHGQYLH